MNLMNINFTNSFVGNIRAASTLWKSTHFVTFGNRF